MISTTLSDFRKDIKSYIDDVIINLETLVINRGKDSGVVIMSISEYNSLCSTHHEMSSKANKDRLDSAIEKFQKNEGFEKQLLEG